MALPGVKHHTQATKRAAASKSKKQPKRKGGRPPRPRPQEVVGDDGSVRRKPGRRRKYHPVVIESDSDQDMKRDLEYRPDGQHTNTHEDTDAPENQTMKADEDYTASFPVVLTTYDIIMRDRSHLQHYDWGYIVVDEGHRLKNMDCKLMREIKKYSSAGRMILTGTPLHVSSLLNFFGNSTN